MDKWDIDEAEAIYWIAPEAAYGFTQRMKDVYGFSLTRNLVVYDGTAVFKWCTLSDELREIGYKIFELFKDESFRNKITKGMGNIKKRLDVKIKELHSLDISKLSVDELFGHLEFFTNCYIENFSYGGFVEPFDLIFPEEYSKAMLKYKLSQEENNIMSSVTDTSFLNIETLKLLKIAQNNENELEKHLREYEWIATGHGGKINLTISYFKERIYKFKDIRKEILKLQDIEKEIREKKKAILKKYPFDDEAITIFKIIDEIGPLHDLRKENFMKAVYYSDVMREKIGERLGYSLEELQYFELKEFQVLRKGDKIDREELERRRKFIVLDVDNKKNRFKVYSGKEAEKVAKKELKLEYGQLEHIEGQCASNGKANGRVKIIFGAGGFSKMEQGDILITGMTRPEMMVVIRKASAIVTDEGGLTCHAAIVARELGIPCVIATKIGTKVFKDNDLVEVDADKGVVRKLDNQF